MTRANIDNWIEQIEASDMKKETIMELVKALYDLKERLPLDPEMHESVTTPSSLNLREFFEKEKASIVAEYRAEGAGIGKDDEGDFIMVYMRDEAHKGTGDWKGVRLIFKTTGPILIQSTSRTL